MPEEQNGQPGGHVFIVRSRVQDIACDAWCISCNISANPSKERWLPKHILDRKPPYEWDSPPRGWGNDGVRAFKLSNWPEKAGSPQPWLLNVGGSREKKKIAWYIKGVEELFRKLEEDLNKSPTPLYGRAKHLVALPIVGTGQGGLGQRAGEAVLALLPTFCELAVKHQIDVALAVPHAAGFAAAQAARTKLLHDKKLSEDVIWPSEFLKRDSDLRKKAEELAGYASQGKLALFLGAGVSSSAGLPPWGNLLSQSAKKAGMTKEDWNEVKELNLSVLDQAAIVERKLASQKNSDTLGKVVCSILQEHHQYSLTHALLAGLPVREAVTTNFDQLFEDAWTEHEPDTEPKRPPVLPYQTAFGLDRWLLKLHGCVSHPEDIVLTRTDFMRYAEGRGALAGVVQTLLITRHLLIVGFSLDDPNFHEIVDAVRRVLERRKTPGGQQGVLGTALMTEDKRVVADLWSDELRWLSFGQKATYTSQAGRLLQIFLDYLASQVRDSSRLVHLLNERYGGLLSPDERQLAKALKDLGRSLSNSDHRAPAWKQVRKWLASLGYPFQERNKTAGNPTVTKADLDPLQCGRGADASSGRVPAEAAGAVEDEELQ